MAEVMTILLIILLPMTSTIPVPWFVLKNICKIREEKLWRKVGLIEGLH